MIRVLHLVWGLEVGGKEQFLWQLAQGLPRDRIETHVWSLRCKGPFYERLKAAGHPVEFIGKHPGIDFLMMKRLAVAIQKFGPDVVHVHELTSMIATLANPFLRPSCPVVVTLHGGHRGLSCVKRTLNKYLLRRASAVAAVSREMAEDTSARVGSGVRVLFIPYGVDTRRYADMSSRRNAGRRELGFADEDRVAIMVARLTRPKRQDLFVRAAAMICEKVPNARFVLVGDGPLRSGLERLAAEAGLSGRVVFTGERADVADLLAASDVGVLSTDREGLPFAVLEYMAAGLPVIASSVSGLPEMVADTTTGFLVPRGDVASLVDRLETLLEDRALSGRMGAAGRDVVDRTYALDVMCRTYGALYEEMSGVDRLGDRVK
jgi:glycosyltransferase involved in cell wall biosynthesis